MIRRDELPKLKGKPTPPAELAGQWIAWDKDETKIVAHAAEIDEAFDAAIAAGHTDAVLEKVRIPGVPYIGTT